MQGKFKKDVMFLMKIPGSLYKFSAFKKVGNRWKNFKIHK